MAAAALFFYFREKKVRPGNRDLNVFFLIVGLTTVLLRFILAHYTSYYFAGYTFFVLDLAYFLSTYPSFKKIPRWDLVRSFSCLFAVWSFVWGAIVVSCYYTVGFEDFSYSQSVSYREEIVDTIPAADRETPGAVYALDCDAAVYLDGGIVTGNPYFCSQSWWASDNSEVLPSVIAYLSSEDKPKWLLVSPSEETAENFGDVVAEYYAATGTANEKFTIYLEK
jgi:hypothetical protein